ncbi:MAG: hypothetical protein P4N59_29095 [Negativicutes bacterium]|nr:hypothetical protein [Negativicutes bacterium]
MMDKAKVIKLVRDKMPNGSDTAIDALTDEIINDLEPIILTYIRRMVARELESQYDRQWGQEQ